MEPKRYYAYDKAVSDERNFERDVELYRADDPALLERERAFKAAQEECTWTGPGEFGEEYITSCGQEFCWSERTPQEDGVKFCHNCGKKVKFVSAIEQIKEG